MCTIDPNTALTFLVEEAIQTKMKAREPFTALDVSNELKARHFPVRHGAVAAQVRDIYASGAMGHYDYDRRLIDVVTEGGTKQTQTFLYLHDEAKEREYTARAQDALPPVPADQARSLDDVVPANDPTSPLRGAGSASRRVASGRSPRRGRAARGARRDGALPIPCALARLAGWSVGDVLSLSVDAAVDGGVMLTPDPSAAAADATERSVRVWGDLRVRICKTKLGGAGLSGAAAIQLSVEGSAIRILV